jgi:hypothetical protein
MGKCISPAAAQEYKLRYPSLRDPDVNVFRRLEGRLRETGNVTSTARVNTDRPQTVHGHHQMKMP